VFHLTYIGHYTDNWFPTCVFGLIIAWITKCNILWFEIKTDLKQWKRGCKFFWCYKKVFLFSKGRRKAQGPTYLPIKLVSGTLFAGVKRQRLETHLHLELRFIMSLTILRPIQYAFTSYIGTTLALLCYVVTRTILRPIQYAFTSYIGTTLALLFYVVTRTILRPIQYAFTSYIGTTLYLLCYVVTSTCFKQSYTWRCLSLINWLTNHILSDHFRGSPPANDKNCKVSC